MAWDVGDTVPVVWVLVDDQGSPVSASGVTLTITDPDGSVVGSTIPTSTGPGRWEYDFVPSGPGLHQVRWASTTPAEAWADVVDVISPLVGGVISLADAKQHLNKNVTQLIDDEELRPVIAAAIERVDRHLWTKAERDAGSSLTARASVSPSEVLAVKTVLDVYWAPQRSRLSRTVGGGGGPAATELDSGPAGAASLTTRLIELLGLPADGKGAPSAEPSGSYPDPLRWPDPIEVCDIPRWWL